LKGHQYATSKQECLDHFVVLGERHLNRIVSEFVRYYHGVRPHQSLENRPPGVEQRPEETVSFDPDSIVCHEALGGLLKHYERRAA
jgi:putative transposase